MFGLSYYTTVRCGLWKHLTLFENVFDHSCLRRIFGIKLRDRVSTEELRKNLPSVVRFSHYNKEDSDCSAIHSAAHTIPSSIKFSDVHLFRVGKRDMGPEENIACLHQGWPRPNRWLQEAWTKLGKVLAQTDWNTRERPRILAYYNDEAM